MKKVSDSVRIVSKYKVINFREIRIGQENGCITYTSTGEKSSSIDVKCDDVFPQNRSFKFSEQGVKVYICGNTVHLPVPCDGNTLSQIRPKLAITLTYFWRWGRVFGFYANVILWDGGYSIGLRIDSEGIV